MENDDRPVREEPDGEGRRQRQPSYAAFARDKRPRTKTSVKASEPEYRSVGGRRDFGHDGGYGHRNGDDAGRFAPRDGGRSGGYGRQEKPARRYDDGGHENRRRSFNPNFDADNRLIDGSAEGRHDDVREGRGHGDEFRGNYRSENFRGGYRSSDGFRNDRDGFRRSQKAESSGYRSAAPRGGYDRAGSGYAAGGEADGGRPRRSPFGGEPQNSRGGYGREKDRFCRDDKKQGKRMPGRPRREASLYDKDNYPTFPAPVIDDKIRLNRYIAMSGICSRREADEFIQSGAVTVNGLTVTELGAKVSKDDEVRFHGEVIRNEKKVYIVMNKPKGFVTTVEDPHADKTVMDLVSGVCRERVYPVGRLDKNSLGVLLITNDGDLARQLMHPSYAKKKIYQVTLDKPLTRADMDTLVNGFELEDGEIHADEISYVSEKKNVVGVEIHSGRNRIVRRMFEHVGYHVTKLDRVYFAGLTKQKLKRGQWRFLTPREVQILLSGRYE